MRILVITQYFSPEPWRINGIVQQLTDKGHSVTVLTGIPNYPDGIVPEEYRKGRRRKECIYGASIIRVSLIARGKSSLRLCLNYLSFVFTASWQAMFLANKYDIIFGYQLSPVTSMIPAILLKWKWRLPLVIYCLDLWPDSVLATGHVMGKNILYRILHLMSRFIYRQADTLVVSSRSFITFFHESMKITHAEIQYCPQHGEAFGDGDEQREIGLPKGKTNLVFTGNIGQAQGVNTLIHAAAMLRDRNDLLWHFVGSGSALPESQSLAENLGVADQVRFHGRKSIEDMSAFYSQADALLLSLKGYGWVSKTMPGKLQGYMSSGKPILGSINGDASLIISEAMCGYCAPAEDALAFAEIVRMFLALPPDQRQAMGSRARQYFNIHFSKEIAIDRLSGILSQKL